MQSSSNNGISNFPHVSTYLNQNPSSLSSFSLNDDNQAVLFHEDLISYYVNVGPVIDTAANRSLAPVSTRKNKSKKVDRHSKIFTAQGPRDRRVRLSIGISRKFFGLQDLLGFDKASLTLDWLLTKSKSAIRELLKTKKVDDDADIARCFLNSPSEIDGEFVKKEAAAEADTVNDECSEKTAASSKRKRSNKTIGGRKTQPKMMIDMDRVAKDSRAKARERAKQRTREKMNSQRVEQQFLSPPPPPPPPPAHSQTLSRRRGSCNSSNSSCTNDTPAGGFFCVNPRIRAEVSTTIEELFLEQCGSIERQILKPACSSSNFASIDNEEGVHSEFNIWPSSSYDNEL